MTEIWRQFLSSKKGSFENRYEASNHGNIRTIRTTKKGEKIINHKLYKRKDGYLDTKIGTKRYLVHRLVWEAFYGQVPEGYEINHINMVRNDNHLENLNLLTHIQNVRWGDGNTKRSKPILQFSLDGHFIKEYISESEAAKITGIPQGQIAKCVTGKYKQTKGFIFTVKNPLDKNRYLRK